MKQKERVPHGCRRAYMPCIFDDAPVTFVRFPRGSFLDKANERVDAPAKSRNNTEEQFLQRRRPTTILSLLLGRCEIQSQPVSEVGEKRATVSPG
jgi:hypothetical protein